MWWLSLMLAGAGPVNPAADYHHIILSEGRMADVRCVMLAGLTLDEVKRGVSENSYGLTAARTQKLAGLLSDIIIAETGAGAEQVRALYHQDFEDFSAQSVTFSDQSARQESFEASMARCRPIFDSMDFSDSDQAVTRKK